MNESWRHFPVDVITMNFLTPGVHKKVRHIQTNLQVKAVGLSMDDLLASLWNQKQLLSAK